MTREKLLEALRQMAPIPGSFFCLGCGYEHSCSLHGCAVIRAAREEIMQLAAENAAMRRKLSQEDAEACRRPMSPAERDAILDWPASTPPNPPLTHNSATAPSRGRAELDSAQVLDAPVALSLEELRKMDGEPVWVIPLGDACGWIEHWNIVHAGFILAPSLAKENGMHLLMNEYYGQTWLAYRRKPEEGTT